MKRTYLLTTLVCLTLLSKGQVKSIAKSDKNIGSIHCIYAMDINLDKGDTIAYIYMSFQNAKYTAITDIASLMFPLKKDSAEVFQFLKDLKTALPEMGQKQTIAWKREMYNIYLYDFNKDLYLAEMKTRGDGYTTLSKKEVEKLINWFEEIGFKK